MISSPAVALAKGLSQFQWATEPYTALLPMPREPPVQVAAERGPH